MSSALDTTDLMRGAEAGEVVTVTETAGESLGVIIFSMSVLMTRISLCSRSRSRGRRDRSRSGGRRDRDDSRDRGRRDDSRDRGRRDRSDSRDNR